MTEQEARKEAHRRWGVTAYASVRCYVDSDNGCEVGAILDNGICAIGVGDTWAEAFKDAETDR